MFSISALLWPVLCFRAFAALHALVFLRISIVVFVKVCSNQTYFSTGYGNLSPSTGSGQVFCVIYALFGIPLNLAFLNQLSKCLSLHLGRPEWGMISMGHQKVRLSFSFLGLLLCSACF